MPARQRMQPLSIVANARGWSVAAHGPASHTALEIGDGTPQPFLKIDVWFPAEQFPGPCNIRLARLRVAFDAVLFLIDNSRRIVRECVHNISKLKNGQFARIADIDRI